MAAHADAIAEALATVREKFPFEGYIDAAVESFGTIGSVCLRHLPRGARILDFGCGPCDKTGILPPLGFECVGYDDFGDPWHSVDDRLERIREYAEDIGIDLRVASGDEYPFEPESFDMVMLHDVLEHIHDSPRELLNGLVTLMKPGGYLFVTVPNAANLRKRAHLLMGRTNLPPYAAFYWSPNPWRGHVREYVRGDLRSLTAFLGLDLVELGGRHHMLRKIPRLAHGPYRALTSVLTGCRDTWMLVARKPSGWQAETEPRDSAAVAMSPWAATGH